MCGVYLVSEGIKRGKCHDSRLIRTTEQNRQMRMKRANNKKEFTAIFHFSYFVWLSSSLSLLFISYCPIKKKLFAS